MLDRTQQKNAMHMGAELTAQILAKGGVPEIMIGAVVKDRATHELDYVIASPLEAKQVRYIITRLSKLIDGSLKENN